MATLDGKTALVVGGGTGIGRATAVRDPQAFTEISAATFEETLRINLLGAILAIDGGWTAPSPGQLMSVVNASRPKGF